LGNGRRLAAITGIGLITPLGTGRDKTWQALCAGHSGIAQRRFGDRHWCVGAVDDFAPQAPGGPDRSVAFALRAAQEALADAGLDPASVAGSRSAVVISSSKGGVLSLTAAHESFVRGGRFDGAGSMFMGFLPAAPAMAVAGRYGVCGTVLTFSSACAAGAHAIIEATHLIEEGRADVVLAGGTEASLHPLILSSYERMGVLARANGNPAACCKPFDARRTGFAASEGCAMLVLEHAARGRRRAAAAYACVSGAVSASDAYQLTSLREDGAHVARAVTMALQQAKLRPRDIDYVNAHGTGTRQNDAVETRALKRALGDAAVHVPISSTKGALGHLLGAAGSVEAAICALSMRDGLLPPTLNLEHPDAECDLDYIPQHGRRADIAHALSLSFGFGGQIGVLAFSRIPE